MKLDSVVGWSNGTPEPADFACAVASERVPCTSDSSLGFGWVSREPATVGYAGRCIDLAEAVHGLAEDGAMALIAYLHISFDTRGNG